MRMKNLQHHNMTHHSYFEFRKYFDACLRSKYFEVKQSTFPSGHVTSLKAVRAAQPKM